MTESAVYVLEKMAHGFKRMGRAGGAGFYDYIDDEKVLWPGLSVFRRSARPVPLEDVRDRLAYAPAIAALRGEADPAAPAPGSCSDPALLASARQFASSLGLSAFVERASELAARYGERFEPPPTLVERAERREPL